jgi:hypothetical protein
LIGVDFEEEFVGSFIRQSQQVIIDFDVEAVRDALEKQNRHNLAWKAPTVETMHA